MFPNLGVREPGSREVIVQKSQKLSLESKIHVLHVVLTWMSIIWIILLKKVGGGTANLTSFWLLSYEFNYFSTYCVGIC